MITLEIPIIPVAKARPRFTKSGHTYTPKKTESFEQALRWHWKKSGHAMMPDVPLQVSIHCFIQKPKKPKHIHPTTRPDADNFAKSVLDGLNGFAWRDDSLVTDLSVYKRYSDEPKIVLLITEAQ